MKKAGGPRPTGKINQDVKLRIFEMQAAVSPHRDTRHTVLNSWKEIANYLQRGVRTVQRWEAHLQLPVRRIGTGKRSPVYANVAELDFWLSTVEAARPAKKREVRVICIDHGLCADNRRLRLTLNNLARAVAENSVRHRKQAEGLRARLLQMRSQLKRA